jgi:hypothetical protein
VANSKKHASLLLKGLAPMQVKNNLLQTGVNIEKKLFSLVTEVAANFERMFVLANFLSLAAIFGLGFY